MLNQKTHSIITLLLACLFVCSLVWTFNTQVENENLNKINKELTMSVQDLNSANEAYQAYYVHVVDSLTVKNDSLRRVVSSYKQELIKLSERDRIITNKYTDLHAQIKNSHDDSVA